MQSLKLRLLGYLSGAWHYRWYGLLAAFGICFIGWFAIALTPNVFESEAKVYIDTDTLLGPLLKGLAVTTDADQEVSIMLRTLLTTPNLERVVRATNPVANSLSSAKMEDAIISLRRNVTLKQLGAKNLYSIAYRDRDPRHAQAVSEALLSALVDSNIGNLREDSDNVRTFLDNQISDYERKLDDADKRRADFKTAHLSQFTSTPTGDAVDVEGGVLGSQTAVTQAQNALGEAIARRDSLREQLSDTHATMDVNVPTSGNSTGEPISIRGQLAQALARLNDLRTRFTDSHPDVIAASHLVARLQAEIASGADVNDENTQGISNPAYVAIRARLADEQANVAVAQDRLAVAQQRLSTSQNSALQGISVQRQYEDLDRDYRVLHDNYEQLVARREAANISEAAGGQQSTVFRVIDPPRKADRPVAPNRLLLNGLVLIGAIATGIALAIAISELSGKFISLEPLTEAFAIPIIGAVTVIHSAADAAKHRRAVSVFALGVSVLLLGYLFVLFFFHTNIALPEGTFV